MAGDRGTTIVPGHGVGPEPSPGEFNAFYRAHYRLVLTVAEHRLGSLTDAEEVASETFRIALQRHLGGERLTVAWLYGVVRNLVGNEYRRRTRQAALFDRLEAEREAPAADAPGERRDRIVEALGHVPEAHQEILKMAYWDELTIAEIAEILGATEGTVRVRLFRARKALGIALKRLELREHWRREG